LEVCVYCGFYGKSHLRWNKVLIFMAKSPLIKREVPWSCEIMPLLYSRGKGGFPSCFWTGRMLKYRLVKLHRGIFLLLCCKTLFVFLSVCKHKVIWLSQCFWRVAIYYNKALKPCPGKHMGQHFWNAAPLLIDLK